MDPATLAQVQEQLDENIKGRFPAGTVERATLLQYGDTPLSSLVSVRRAPVTEAPVD